MRNSEEKCDSAVVTSAFSEKSVELVKTWRLGTVRIDSEFCRQDVGLLYLWDFMRRVAGSKLWDHNVKDHNVKHTRLTYTKGRSSHPRGGQTSADVYSSEQSLAYRPHIQLWTDCCNVSTNADRRVRCLTADRTDCDRVLRPGWDLSPAQSDADFADRSGTYLALCSMVYDAALASGHRVAR